MSKYIFGKGGEHLVQIERRVRNSNHLFLFLDYDGTLVGIRSTPHLAVPSDRLRLLLKRLRNLRSTTLGVITGRSLADIKSLLKLTGIVVAANHGFEMIADGKNWIHPGVSKRAPDLRSVSTAIRHDLRTTRGVLVEHKGSTLSIHYRNVAPTSVGRLRSVVASAVLPFHESLVLSAGKKVIEIRPNVAWSKGHAVLHFLKHTKRPGTSLVVYCGDDVTDEDAFSMLPKKSVTIRVGKAGRSRARFYVRSVTEMQRMLHLIYAWRRWPEKLHGGPSEDR